MMKSEWLPLPDPFSHTRLCPNHSDSIEIFNFIFGVDAGVIFTLKRIVEDEEEKEEEEEEEKEKAWSSSVHGHGRSHHGRHGHGSMPTTATVRAERGARADDGDVDDDDVEGRERDRRHTLDPRDVYSKLHDVEFGVQSRCKLDDQPC